ncbi:MAG: DsbA family protein [Paracoccaceae bacterium]
MRLPIALCCLMAATPALAEMTDSERSALREEIRAYLLENPEVILEAMDELQARQDVAAAARDKELLSANMDAIINDGHSWVGGNPNGDVTIVEFMDYRCGYCRKAHAEVNELVSSDGNIRYIVKEYPILGEESLLSSQFAIAVQQLHGDEAYKTAHNALITLRSEATVETLGLLAGDLGLDPAPILARMGGPEVQAVLQANFALGQTMEINGTPTFVMGDTLLRGYVELESMRQIVADERAG